jgi:hypothetical protein
MSPLTSTCFPKLPETDDPNLDSSALYLVGGLLASLEVVLRVPYFAVIGLLLALPTAGFAQQRKIYLDPDNSFSAYFASALQTKKVPVTVTLDQKQADFTAQFQATGSDGSIVKGVLSRLGAGTFSNGSFNEVIMTIVNANNDVIFNYTCKKQTDYMDASSNLATSVAECLAKHWKDKLN